MPKQPLFAGLVFDEFDHPVESALVGDEPCYVVNDAGFRRHIPAEQVTVRATAVMSGVVRAIASPDFRGVDLTAEMGGCEIVLRRSTIVLGEAVVDVFAMWGGIELRVPDSWVVINQVVPVLGGVDQKARASSPDGPRLIVRGTVVMGGVDISN